MSNSLVLPDSRLRDPKATVMADWPLPDGTTVRLELEPIYCFHCGKPNGYVPTQVMSFVSWLCQDCSHSHGELASGWQSSDQDFWDTVAGEMLDRFGRVLTQHELELLAQGHSLSTPFGPRTLGPDLALLERESPYHQ